MYEKAPVLCAYCRSSLEGRPRFASGGYTFCDETCKTLYAHIDGPSRGGEIKAPQVSPGLAQMELRGILSH